MEICEIYGIVPKCLFQPISILSLPASLTVNTNAVGVVTIHDVIVKADVTFSCIIASVSPSTGNFFLGKISDVFLYISRLPWI